ncbi:MAG: tetratricopeptide repeat protein [Chloroflexi bacterium]|nr:tetratricopeptide repeat protein [Chloroflexota bacterium]
MNQRQIPALAALFLIASLVAAGLLLSQAVQERPAFGPTVTPRPTLIPASPLPSPTPPPTATPDPAGGAAYIIATDTHLIESVREALAAAGMADEAVVLEDDPRAHFSLREVDPGSYLVTAVAGEPPLLRLDQPPVPWEIDAPLITPLPGTPDEAARYLVALLLLRDGQVTQSREQVRALRIEAARRPGEVPSTAFALYDFTLARLAAAEGELTTALELYSQSIRRSPDLAASIVGRGNVYFRLGDANAALAAYEQAVGLGVETPLLDFNQAVFGVATLQAVEESLGETPAVLTLRAYINRDELATALPDLQAAAQMAPNLPDALHNLAFAYDQLERPQDSARVYADLIVLRPDDPQLYIARGLALRRAGELAEAYDVFGEAADLAPENAQPLLEQAEIRLEQNDLREAQRLAEEVLILDPEAGRAYAVIGDVLLAGEAYREASVAYDDAIRLGVETAEVYANRAWSRHNIRAMVGAVRDYRQAIVLGAGNPLLFYRMGFALYDLGQYADALEAATGAVNGDLEEGDTYALLAICLDANFLRDEAERAYQEAIRRDEVFADPDALVDRPLWTIGSVSRARTILLRLDEDG